MLIPADLVTDADLRQLMPEMEAEFGTTDALSFLLDARQTAVVDWLAPRLEAAGYQPALHRTWKAPLYAYGYTSSAYTDYTTEAGDEDADDLPLVAIFATPASDCLYVGLGQPFTGLHIRCDGTVNSTASVLTVKVWSGREWAGVPGLDDQTAVAAGKTLSGGGDVRWTLPDRWALLAIDGETAYWAQITLSVTPSAGTVATQVLPIVRSRLAYAALLYTKSLLHRQGSAGRRGAWLEQGQDEDAQAEKALGVVLPLITDEFDSNADGAVTTGDEATRSGWGWTLERG